MAFDLVGRSRVVYYRIDPKPDIAADAAGAVREQGRCQLSRDGRQEQPWPTHGARWKMPSSLRTMAISAWR